LKRSFQSPLLPFFADGKRVQHLLNFAVAHHAAQAHAAGVIARHHHFQTAGFDVQEVELLHCRPDRTAAYLFNNPNAVIGIDNLVADVEIQVCTIHV